MRATLSARDRRMLAIGVVTIGSLFGLSRGLPAYREWETARTGAAAASAERLAFARQAVKLLPALRDTLKARRARLAMLDSLLVTGNSPAAAAASLAAIVEELADSADVKVNALQIRADTIARGPLSRVGIRITGTGDVVGLSAFLRSIESDERPLAVRELAVSQPEPAAPDSKPEMLRIDVLVETIGRIKPERAP